MKTCANFPITLYPVFEKTLLEKLSEQFQILDCMISYVQSLTLGVGEFYCEFLLARAPARDYIVDRIKDIIKEVRDSYFTTEVTLSLQVSSIDLVNSYCPTSYEI